MAPPSQRQIGRYVLHGKMASGGMATVHFGRLIGGAGFSRTVAIKRLHQHLAGEPEFVSTLLDEARLAARIHHPHVVPTLDVVSADGELLVVMEYVRGESLARLLKAGIQHGGRVPLPIASAIALGALQGLHAAHEATSDQGVPLGIVHRDVSPQNILVGVDGVARIIDFGVAKAAGRLQTTRDGELKGKTAYMSPEQLQEGHATRVSDVYAMSIVLWEMLANKRLFAGENDAVVYGKALAGAKEPPSLYAPDLPAALDALVMKGLARNPDDRFATAKDMAEALVRAVSPSLPMEVGAYVEQMAGEGLAQRAAVLAEIESSSGKSTLPFAPESSRGPSDEVPTLTAQSSSLSVGKPDGVPRAQLGWKAGALGVGGLVAALAIGVLVWRSSTSTAPTASGASPPPAPAAEASQRPAKADVPAVPSATSASAPSATSDDAGATAQAQIATTATQVAPPPPPATSPPGRPGRPPPATMATTAKRSGDTVETSGF
jgi:eukaryotic-like serine/threonine-protein kinase